MQRTIPVLVLVLTVLLLATVNQKTLAMATTIASKSSMVCQPKSDTTVLVRFGEPNDNSAPHPRFAVAYWSMRGLAAPLRMMLCATRTDFACHMYDSVEDDSSGFTSSYFLDKANNLLHHSPFMNLPFVVDSQENLVVTQTNACLQYLGEELGIMGHTKAERVLCLMLLCEIYDLRNNMVQFAYRGTAADAAATVATAQKHFAKVNRHLELKQQQRQGESSSSMLFTVGNSFSAPDFHLFEMIDQYDHLCRVHGLPDCLTQEYPMVRTFYTAFAQLE